MKSCKYYFGITKNQLDNLCMTEIEITDNPNSFYVVRINLITEQLKKELDSNGVCSPRVKDLYDHLYKWKAILNEEQFDE